MYRLTITFCILAQAFAQQELVGKKIADPAVAATADAPLYELMKAEYLADGCEDAGWGPFPNATSTSLTAEAYSKAHGTSGLGDAVDAVIKRETLLYVGSAKSTSGP